MTTLYTEPVDRIFVVGPPGSGKTTIAKLLVGVLGWSRLSAGGVARALAQQDPEVRKLLEAGEMAPRETMDELFARRLQDPEPMVIDGFPRYDTQAQLVRQQAARSLVVALDVPVPVLMARLKDRQRDYDEKVEWHRYALYVKDTLPALVDLYRGGEVWISFINGHQPLGRLSETLLFWYYSMEESRGALRVRQN